MHRSLVFLVASVLLLAFGSAVSARTFRRTCRDGVPRLRKGIACDVDQHSNDVCTFAIPNGVPDGVVPPIHVAVHTGQKQVMVLGAGFRVVLRCLRHHAFVITTPVPPNRA